MPVEAVKKAKENITKWLNDNGHQVKLVEDDKANFHFEIDYPLGSMKRQRIIQPNDVPELIVVLNGVAIADEHKKEIEKMSDEEKESFYDEIRKDLIFQDNSYDMNSDENGVVQQMQFSYEFYFDALTKTQLFKSLLLNHRTLLYIVTKFNEKFGVPEMPEETKPENEPIQ